MTNKVNKMARILEEQWGMARNLYEAEGYSFRKISADTGISVAGIHKRAKKEGWAKESKKPQIFSERSEKVRLYDRDGFLYVMAFIDSAGKRFCKIGISKDTEKRLNQLMTGIPFDIVVKHRSYHRDSSLVERVLHQLFAEKNIRGEWFDLSDDDLVTIKSLTAVEGF